MRLKFLSIVLFNCMFWAYINAQNNCTMIASVTDQSGNPIEVFNGFLLNPLDSSYIAGDYYVNAKMIITAEKKLKYLLSISALGYNAYYQMIDNTLLLDTIDLGSIILDGTALQEVTVTALRDIISYNGSDMIVNVEKSALKEAGTAIDILQNTPKIFLDRNGSFSILGKGQALIYLNGQLISNAQLLSTISSSDIKQLEIIENPSAKYDASGNAVINIITKSNLVETRRLSLQQRLEHGKHFRSYSKMDTYFKFGKLLLQANYGIRPWTWGGKNNQIRTNNTVNTYGKIENYFEQTNNRLDHDFSFSSAYSFSPSTKLQFNYIGSIVGGEKDANTFRKAEVTGSDLLTINGLLNGPLSQKSNTSNLSFLKKIDTLGSALQLSAQYSTFKFNRSEDNRQALLQGNLEENIYRNSVNDNDIGVYTFQLDYTKVLKSSRKIEMGLKSVLVQNASFVRFVDILLNGETSPLPQFSNGFNYDENILAGYLQSEFPIQRSKLIMGIRSEWTKMEGYSQNFSIAKPEKIDRSYLNIFPSISYNVPTGKNANLVLDYSYRINRPIFQDLNPYVLYVDAFVSLRGNPLLVPEYAHAFAANYFVKDWSISLDYTRSKNKINQIYRSLDSSNPDVITFIKENLKYTDLYSLSISRPFSFKKYSGFLMLSGIYDDHRISDISSTLANQRFTYMIQMNHSILLPWNLKADAFINYTSNRVDGVYTDNPISYVNLSLSKAFLNNSLRVTLWGNDVFDKFRYTGTSKFNNMNMTYLSEGDYHLIRLALNWTFGKLNTNQFKKKEISNDELNRINSNM